MPTYDYVCHACGHQFEQFQPMTAKLLKTCPRCRKHALRRLIGTGAGVIFKGSGFYQTDYRSDSYRKGAQKESKPPATPASGDASAKPASKSDGNGGKKKADSPP